MSEQINGHGEAVPGVHPDVILRFADHEVRIRLLEQQGQRLLGALALLLIEIPIATAVLVAFLGK